MRSARTLVASLGLLAVVAVAAAWLSSGGLPANPDQTLAAGPFDSIDIRCSDVFLDLPPLAAKDGPPGAEDLRVAKAMVRLQITGPTAATVRTQGYGGIETASVNPPDDQTCADDQTAGHPESNRFDADQKFNSPNVAFGNIQATATLVDKVAPAGVDHANFTNCFFSPTVGWVRSDSNTPLIKTGGGLSIVNGQSDVYIIAPTDNTPCDGSDQFDIIDGRIDVNEDTVVNTSDDFSDAVLNVAGGTTDQVDIIDGRVDVNEDGAITAADDRANVVLEPAGDQVDIIDGDVDVNEDAAITTADDLTDVQLLPAPLRLVTIDREREARTDDTVTNTGITADADGTQGTPPPQPQPIDADAVFDDWDGDGCTDWDELGRKSGGDPFNPEDCDKNYNGIFNILVTLSPSGKGANGSTLAGVYFACIARIDDPKTPPTGTRNVTAYLICYQDNGAATPMSERINTGEDGLAGPPPPPPYGYGELTTLTGQYTPGTNVLTLAGCFASVEGDLGPNVYVTATIGGANPKNKGFVGINANETKANCNGGTPSGVPAPEAVPLFIAEQPDGFDHDGDGCTDAQELDPTPARQGRDPYNPYDCDSDYYNIINILATVTQQGVCKGQQPAPFCTGVPDQPPTLVPGAYFQCKADSQPNGAVGTTIRIRLGCYADIIGIDVNFHTPGVFGDGLGGVAPPPPYGEVHNAINFVDGTISGSTITAEGCLANLHGTLGPNSYVEATLDGATGIGSADIWTARTDCTDPDGPPNADPTPTFAGAPVQTAEQGKGIDSDGDNCSDKEELGSVASQGGLRDPYNIGDFMSVHTGPVTNLAKDQVVSVADISAIVARFGTNDSSGTTKINRNTDPKSRPTGTIYHPSYDRGGPIPFGASPGALSRQNPATTGSGAGSITIADISAAVTQFGQSCAAAP